MNEFLVYKVYYLDFGLWLRAGGMITTVPFKVNIMDICFVYFEGACLLRLVVASILIAMVSSNVNFHEYLLGVL